MEDVFEDVCEDVPAFDAEEMRRERNHRERQFKNLGYRDGVEVGRQASVQAGFDAGYIEAVATGYTWGQTRGLASALAVLPAEWREAIVGNGETCSQLMALGSQLASVSSEQAFLEFHQEGTTVVSVESAQGEVGKPGRSTTTLPANSGEPVKSSTVGTGSTEGGSGENRDCCAKDGASECGRLSQGGACRDSANVGETANKPTAGSGAGEGEVDLKSACCRPEGGPEGQDAPHGGACAESATEQGVGTGEHVAATGGCCKREEQGDDDSHEGRRSVCSSGCCEGLNGVCTGGGSSDVASGHVSRVIELEDTVLALFDKVGVRVVPHE